MYRILFSIVLFGLLADILHAQKEEETLFSKARVSGGFGGPFWTSSRGVGDLGWGGGGGGGVVFGHFFLGGFGQAEVFDYQGVDGRARGQPWHGRPVAGSELSDAQSHSPLWFA